MVTKKQINDLLLKMQVGEKCIGETANELLNLVSVYKRSLADIEIEYRHPTGKKKGKLRYDDDEETLILDFREGFVTLPNIEDCNVLVRD